MDLQLLLSRIESFCASHNLKRQTVYIDSGVGKDFGGAIRNGSEPSIGKVYAVATRLDCSVDYLLGRTDNAISHKLPYVSFGDLSNNSGIVGNVGSTIYDPARFNEQKSTLISLYEELDPIKKAKLLVYANELKKMDT